MRSLVVSDIAKSRTAPSLRFTTKETELLSYQENFFIEILFGYVPILTKKFSVTAETVGKLLGLLYYILDKLT